MNSRKILLCAVLAAVASCVFSSSADAQWRTRYVRRDGLFHVEKYRTGNGITPVGGAVLTALITTAGDVAGNVLGKDVEEETPREIDDSWKQAYAEQQRKANDLLVRTSALVGLKADVPHVDPVAPTSVDGVGTPTNETEAGKNPWTKFKPN